MEGDITTANLKAPHFIASPTTPTPTTLLLTLPEILNQIFAYLTPHQQRRLTGQVCHQWRTIVFHRVLSVTDKAFPTNVIEEGGRWGGGAYTALLTAPRMVHWQLGTRVGSAASVLEKQLIRVTRQPATSFLVKRLFDPAELRLPDGSTEMALIMPGVSKRLRNGSKAQVRILKPHEHTVDQAVAVASTKLDVVLESHSYGRLISLKDYRSLDNKDPVWHLPLPDNGERLATMLGGLLLHSGEGVLLALKVEVYVTLAVMLTDGTVIVGPDNKILQPRSTSCIWIKKEPGPFVYNTLPRQLRSKFFEPATFARYAAVHQLFNHRTSMPVTLKTLYAFKSNKAWSGIEVAAFVFHQLFSQKKIVKAGVIKHLNDALELRNGRSCELLNIIQEMACEMREEEPFPVSKS
ncbi:hypothetical protein BKA57DRAFT_504855 [Linnemannia elongata]|nr:hypothetical protein BKA57DRAFT_504855 [Linnemannia elongata]